MPRELRLRDYLTRDEVAALLRSSKKSPRYGVRNYAMNLLAYRHGLRASEVTELRWSDLDLSTGKAILLTLLISLIPATRSSSACLEEVFVDLLEVEDFFVPTPDVVPDHQLRELNTIDQHDPRPKIARRLNS